MDTPLLTTDFFLTEGEASSQGCCELWFDWVPAVDGEPGSRAELERHGFDLLVYPLNGDRPSRRFKCLDLRTWKHVLSGKALVLVICGPSGVLVRKSVAFRP